MAQQNLSLEDKPTLKVSGHFFFYQIQCSAANAESSSSWKCNPLLEAEHQGKAAKPTNLNVQSTGSQSSPPPPELEGTARPALATTDKELLCQPTQSHFRPSPPPSPPSAMANLEQPGLESRTRLHPSASHCGGTPLSIPSPAGRARASRSLVLHGIQP